MPTLWNGSTQEQKRSVASRSPLYPSSRSDMSSSIFACCVQVIVTSYLFPQAKFDQERLRKLAEKVEKRRLVVDVRFVQSI